MRNIFSSDVWSASRPGNSNVKLGPVRMVGATPSMPALPSPNPIPSARPTAQGAVPLGPKESCPVCRNFGGM